MHINDNRLEADSGIFKIIFNLGVIAVKNYIAYDRLTDKDKLKIDIKNHTDMYDVNEKVIVVVKTVTRFRSGCSKNKSSTMFVTDKNNYH
jgi:hypothetical protein